MSLDNPVWKSVWLKKATTELKSSIIHKSLLVINFNFLIHQFNRPSRKKTSIYIWLSSSLTPDRKSTGKRRSKNLIHGVNNQSWAEWFSSRGIQAPISNLSMINGHTYFPSALVLIQRLMSSLERPWGHTPPPFNFFFF